MPISEAPADVNEPNKPPVVDPAVSEEQRSLEQGIPVSPEETRPPSAPVVRGSRWVDYDSHELLEMISELEDERRWARLREGVLWALLAHAAILLALFLLPRYIVAPRVVDKTAKLDKDEFTYMDTPRFRPKVEIKPITKPPVIDKQTMEEMRKQSAQQAPVTPPQETKPTEPAPVQQQPTQPIPPTPQTQSQ